MYSQDTGTNWEKTFAKLLIKKPGEIQYGTFAISKKRLKDAKKVQNNTPHQNGLRMANKKGSIDCKRLKK